MKISKSDMFEIAKEVLSIVILCLAIYYNVYIAIAIGFLGLFLLPLFISLTVGLLIYAFIKGLKAIFF